MVTRGTATRMRHIDGPAGPIGPRRRRFAVCAAVVVLATLALAVVRVPSAEAATAASSAKMAKHPVTVSVQIVGYQGLTGVSVRLDGRYVTTSLRVAADRLSLVSVPLANGIHNLAFTADSGQIFRRHFDTKWQMTVAADTRKVDLGAFDTALLISSSPATFSGTVAANAVVTLTSGAVTATATADAAGAYSVGAALPDGPATVTLTATDAAGVQTTESIAALVDTQAPQLTVVPIAETLRSARVTVAVNATDAAAVSTLTAKLNGKAVQVVGQASAARIQLKGLSQGINTLVVTALDRGGHITASRQQFLVDSTEKFGAAFMMPGAQGKDVITLQRCMALIDAYNGKPTGVYDDATVAAVRRTQTRYGLPVNGMVGARELLVLGRHIVIDLSELRLYFYRYDRLVKKYHVATGQPRYPTPTGTYAIIQMTKNPTWLPPNSDWAQNATPVPPGASNPLGTRWMGTSASGIGIHGVPASENSSIGTYASHGCIRMFNWDAVQLFTRVVIGTPVIIQR
jgi:peptidoglycan hydrolase-like protein with peptidoglycan-binding domain